MWSFLALSCTRHARACIAWWITDGHAHLSMCSQTLFHWLPFYFDPQIACIPSMYIKRGTRWTRKVPFGGLLAKIGGPKWSKFANRASKRRMGACLANTLMALLHVSRDTRCIRYYVANIGKWSNHKKYEWRKPTRNNMYIHDCNTWIFDSVIWVSWLGFSYFTCHTHAIRLMYLCSSWHVDTVRCPVITTMCDCFALQLVF